MSSDSEELTSVSNEMRIENIDPELDIRSDLFNPLKALLSPEIQIPIKDAPQYNNVAQYESAMKRQQTGESVSFDSLNLKSRKQIKNNMREERKIKFSLIVLRQQFYIFKEETFSID